MKTLIKTSAMALLVGLLGIQNVSAQEGATDHFKDIRIFGGINLGSVSNEATRMQMLDTANYKKNVEGQVGFQGGLSMTFGNHFYVSPGIWYATYTSNTLLVKDGKANDDADFEKETTISTVAVPVRVGFRFINPNNENIFNIRIYGGITGAHVLSVNHKGDDEINLSEKDFENMFVSATAGLGVDVLFLFLDAGYDLGLTNYEKNTSKSRHNSMFINLGVKFKI